MQEGDAAAAERRPYEQITQIKVAWRDCELAVKRDSADEFAALDYNFHFSIIKAAQNQYAIAAYSGIADAFAPDESAGDRISRKYLKWVGLADPEAIGRRNRARAESGGCEPAE